MIDGKFHSETDNFQKVSFFIDGTEYFSAENYFQCAKTVTKEDHEKLRNSGCGTDARTKNKKKFILIFFIFV